MQAVVRAPIGGIVLQRQVGLGQYIAAGPLAGSPVYSIGDLSTVWLIANVRETDASRVHVGQALDVRVPAYPERVFSARIAWVAPSIDATTRRLPVRAEMENGDGALKPMMFATFSIATGEAAAAPAVPESAVIREGRQAHVWVARDDGVIVSRAVEVGRSSAGFAQVVRGLAAGERVVAGGALLLDHAK
jgi:cobalt-zinc-cadmium efflux system membrane fusion protein